MSLSENLYNLGALMKTNLEEKGISGLTGSEGLTTLANKILDIEGDGSSSKSVVVHVTGNSITLGGVDGSRWLNSTGNVVIDWGDGTSNTVNNPSTPLSHTYANSNGHLITFNGDITSLGDTCFYQCSGLIGIIIPDSITNLGEGCFAQCSGLTNIIIPDSVTNIEATCFTNCSGLTSIIIPDSVTNLGDSCFQRCSSLTSITIPDSVTSLNSYCFSDCSSLTNITIPDSVTSLGHYCFYGCAGLTSIIIPSSVMSLGTGCFWECSSLTSVTIPSSVTSLAIGCFADCSGLTSVTIPDSVTSLGNQCFFGCSGLTSIIIPDSVTSLGTECFRGCSGLVNYDLYWETQPVTYDSAKMIVNTGTVFTIPTGTRQLYIDAGYPSNNLVERGSHNYQLNVVSDKDIISSTEVATLTATLSDNSTPVSGEILNYQIKHGSTVIASGTKTTGSDGTASISYTGTGVGDVSVEVSYSTLLQETYELKDGLFRDTSTTPNNKWWSTATTGLITHNTNGITFNNTGTGYSRMHPYTVETLPSTWSEKEQAVKFIDTPFIVEFDIKSISNTNAITLDTNSTLYSNDVSPNDHVKIVCDGSTGKVYINNVEVNSSPFTFTNSWFAFRINSTVELTIDNFVIYTIGTYNLTLSSDKDIISAHDGESATITALLTEDNVPIEDIELEYSIKHDNTVIDSGTITTDSDGEANIVYTATGVGDVDIVVSYGTLLQETYEVQDYHWYDDATSDKSSSFVTLTGQNPTIVHNTDHYTLTGDSNGNNFIYIGTEEYNNVSYEVTLKLNSWGVGIAIGGDNGWGTNTILAYRAADGQIWFYYSNTGQLIDIVRRTGIMQQGTYYKMILTISDNQYTHRIEDMNGNVLLSSQTTQSLPKKRLAIGLMDATPGGSCDVKEIKVKAL